MGPAPHPAARRRPDRVRLFVARGPSFPDHVARGPALWKGHCDARLTRSRPTPRHHAALPYEAACAFMSELTGRDSASREHFTGRSSLRRGPARPSAPRGARLPTTGGTISAARMKIKRDHRVPLSSSADVLG